MGIKSGGPNVNKFSMDLLKWKEITTKRQEKNGTRIFQLPIKKYGQYIEVGSFESGYVRRMNGCYTPYQLNKCEPIDHYYKAYDYNGEVHKWTGKYNKFVGKRRIRIDNEVNRIEYLITYCLKNYYINQANLIENGEFIPKWRVKLDHSNCEMNLKYKDNRVKELREKIMKQEKTIRECFEEIDRISDEKDDLQTRFESTAMELDRNHFEKSDEVDVLKDEIRRMKDYNYDKIEGLNQEIDKLNNEIVDSRDRGALDNLTVFVNNEKYKII